MSNLPLFESANNGDVTITYRQGGTTDVSLIKYGQILQRNNVITPWLDTKLFPVLQITASLSSDTSAHIYWGIGEGNNTPDSYALAKDSITSSHHGTTEWDTRSRWARIHLSGNSGEISYLLKPAPTGIKIVDESGSIVSVTANAMQIVYRDVSGVLGSTDSSRVSEGSALYTSLTNADGQPLNKILDTLTTGQRDNCGANFSSTGSSGDQLVLGTYDQQSTDVVFFMDLSSIDFSSTLASSDEVALTGNYIVRGSYSAPSLTVTSVSLGNADSSITELKPGYLFSSPDGRWISSINSNVITVSGTGGTGTNLNTVTTNTYSIPRETTISHLIHNNVVPIVDHITTNYGWDNNMRVAFVGPDLCVNYTNNPTTFKARLDNCMSVMLHATGAANNIRTTLNAFRNDTTFTTHSLGSSRALVMVYNDIEDVTALNTSFERISVTHIGNPSGITTLTSGQLGSASAYIIDSSAIADTSGVLNIVFGDVYTSNNAIAVVPTDVSGHAQASALTDVSGAYGRVALYYALADISGVQIGTTNTKTTSTNALYVHLADQSGISHSTANPVPITIGGDQTAGLTMDSSLGDVLTQLININSSDISGNSFNINTLSLSNEAAIPVWFKVYDTHEGIVTYAEQTNDYAAAQNVLKLNIAVPPLVTRDIRFEKGIDFKHGLAARVSALHNYDASTEGNLGTTAQSYISTNHAKVALTTSQLIANVAARPEPNLSAIRAFDISRNGVTLRGYLNTIKDSSDMVDKVLFMPLEATGINTTDHNAITLSLNDYSGNAISLSSSVTYSNGLYNYPLIAGGPKLLDLATAANLSAYTVVVNLNAGDDASFAHIANIVDGAVVDTSVVSLTRYSTSGALEIVTGRTSNTTRVRPVNVNTFGIDTDVCQADLFYSALGGTLASLDGSTTDHSATVVQAGSFPSVTTASQLDLSAYLITYNAAVHIISSNSTASQQYLHKTPVNDSSTNRWNYFGISAGHTDGSNWCFSNQNLVGYVHNDDVDTWRTSIVRYDRDWNATNVDVSYYNNAIGMTGVTVSGTYDHDDGFKVSYYDASTGDYSSINRVVVWWGNDASYDFSLSNLGGGTKFIVSN